MDGARVLAVAVADARTRLRRPGTGVLVLVTAVLAWLAVPDPSTGRAIVAIGGARALYTSSALAFATAVLTAFVLSLLGFYLVSNALERDLRTRMGTVVAAAPVRSAEYLAGKLAGNAALLLVVTLGAMAAAMAMQAVRGEGPVQPAVYLGCYALLAVPCIAWVAALALLFECVPFLSGRAGDVAYFFCWMLALPLGMEPWRAIGAPPSWLGRCLDATGMGFVIREVARVSGTSEFSIGGTGFDAGRPPVVFAGLPFTLHAIGVRAATLLVPLVVVALAAAAFRRFDPALTKAVRAEGRGRASRLLAATARAIGRPVLALLDRVAPDAALTFRARPPLLLLAALAAVLGLALPAAAVRQVLLPAAFAVLSAALADVATRDRQSDLARVVFAAPGRRDGFAEWKLGTATAVALVLAGIPALRLLAAQPRAGVSALIGLLFLGAAAVALGIATGTPKAYTALSLGLWYVALNAKGRPPALDYGGWWAQATAASQAGWAAATVAAAATAVFVHRARVARDG